MSEWDPDYDGSWPSGADWPDEEGLEDPDDYFEDDQDHNREVFEDFLDAVSSLLDVLNHGLTEVRTNSDFIALAQMGRPWSRFVDPRYSHPATASRSARIVLWECPDHYATLMVTSNVWQCSFTAALETDESRIDATEFVPDSNSPVIEDPDTLVEIDEFDEATDSDEYQPQKALRDRMLEGFIGLGFSVDVILSEFGTPTEARNCYQRLERMARKYHLLLSEFLRLPGDPNLTLLRQWLDIGEALADDFQRDDWFLSAAGSDFVQSSVLNERSFPDICALLTAVRRLVLLAPFLFAPYR